MKKLKRIAAIVMITGMMGGMFGSCATGAHSYGTQHLCPAYGQLDTPAPAVKPC